MHLDNTTKMRMNFSDRQDSIVREFCKQSKEIPCFQLEGAYFIGCTRHTAAVMFAHDNPEGGDFYVWCQQKLKMLVIPN